MNQAVPPPNDNRHASEPNDRLESWKEIAAYLRRGVRTVQRWEHVEGLPVHRHHHDKRGTVYAFRHEIDAWRENRTEGADTAATDDSAGAGSRAALGSTVRWVSEKLQRMIPSNRKKRLLLRTTSRIFLLFL